VGSEHGDVDCMIFCTSMNTRQPCVYDNTPSQFWVFRIIRILISQIIMRHSVCIFNILELNNHQTIANSFRHITVLTSHCQHLRNYRKSFVNDLPPTGHHLLFRSYHLTQSTFNLPDNGLWWCVLPSNASNDRLMFSAGVSGQFPDSNHYPNFCMVC
jgi:hypothetical protein